jgi:O-antigen ligase
MDAERSSDLDWCLIRPVKLHWALPFFLLLVVIVGCGFTLPGLQRKVYPGSLADFALGMIVAFTCLVVLDLDPRLFPRILKWIAMVIFACTLGMWITWIIGHL